MKKAISNPLTPAQQEEIATLAALPDEQIDTQDIPEVLDWSDKKRGLFYCPVKQQITLNIDVDLLAWFKRRMPQGTEYLAGINGALREYVMQHAAEG